MEEEWQEFLRDHRDSCQKRQRQEERLRRNRRKVRIFLLIAAVAATLSICLLMFSVWRRLRRGSG